MFLTSRLVWAAIGVALAAGLLALLAGAAVAMILVTADGLLVLAALADVARAPAPRALLPARTLPDVLGVGKEVVVRITVRNPMRRAVTVAVHDATPPSLRREPLRQKIVVPAEAVSVLSSGMVPGRRGRIPIGPLTVRTAGPLGLAGRQATLDDAATVRVYPALPGRADVMLRLDRARMLHVGMRSAAVRGGGTEFESMREYHQDDEFRRINWRATARAQHPVTNLYREERNQHVIVLIDAGRAMAASVADVPRFEHALDAAAAVAELASRVGDHVGMLAFSSDVIAMIAPKGSAGQSQRIVEALYTIEPSLDASGYRRAFGALLSRHRRRSLIILLTELGGEASLDPLFDAVPMLLARHLLIVGAVSDPALEAAAVATAASSNDVYEKAAAAAALTGRVRSGARLRRMGAVVVDRPPGALAGRLADEYLRIKAFGRL